MQVPLYTQLHPRCVDREGVNRQDAKLAKGEMIQEPSMELDTLGHRVIGAAIDVHRVLGPGFLESVYEEALCVELKLRGVQLSQQARVNVGYKGYAVGEARLDIVVENCIVLELKAVEQIAPIHIAQLLSYLKATRFRLGFLINFNATLLRHGIRRIIHTP